MTLSADRLYTATIVAISILMLLTGSVCGLALGSVLERAAQAEVTP